MLLYVCSRNYMQLRLLFGLVVTEHLFFVLWHAESVIKVQTYSSLIKQVITMKRGAEKQLTKDGDGSDEETEVSYI
jgi:hypothetical protein